VGDVDDGLSIVVLGAQVLRARVDERSLRLE
jgi:hypothetical protein